MRRSFAVAFLACSLIASSSSCARRPLLGQSAKGLDRKLSTFAFIEEGDLVSLIVGTRAARYRDGSGYLPLELCIANRGLKTLTLTRESFTLVDEQGQRYPAASPRELIEGYEFLDLDRESLSELGEIVFNRFATFTRYGSKFSPTRMARTAQTDIVRDQVVLPKFGYLMDFIYFPAPPAGIKGHRFELFLESPDLPEAVFIKFAVE